MSSQCNAPDPGLAKQLFSPKDLALAIGASESSLRRWIDDGLIQVARTAGGHRRIPACEVIRFVRQMKATLVRPELLGLSELREFSTPSDAELFEALEQGHGSRVRGLLFSLYLSGRSIAWICDQPIRACLARIGELWHHGPCGILLEHRATDLCLQVLCQLRSIIPAPAADAPWALGAAPSGDPYLLPTMMAATVLSEQGYQSLNFGPEMPPELLALAAQQHQARFVWLSISCAADPGRLAEQLGSLARELARHDSHLILGGREARKLSLCPSLPLTYVESMEQLALVAQVAQERCIENLTSAD